MDTAEQTTGNYRVLPLVALRGISLFPGMLLSFDVERPASLGALDAAMDAIRKKYGKNAIHKGELTDFSDR